MNASYDAVGAIRYPTALGREVFETAVANRTRAAWVVICAGLAMLACGPEAEEQDLGSEPSSEWRAHAELGPGFVVWESSRTGSWRIWQRQLDGSGLRQLSPDERRRDHFAPHISPDGRHLVYLSYPPGTNGYRRPQRNAGVTLRLLDLEAGEDRELAPQARSYYEDRAAVWIDGRRVIYIAGDGSTRSIDIHTREEAVLIEPTAEDYGFLIDPTLRHATTGRPAFAAYDAAHQSVLTARREVGCQPYFSRDGNWGFWIARGGGPVRRIDLRTGERGDILLREDPRLPEEFQYVYFPMLSAGQDLIAFGASGDQHDHFRGNYEIFVAPIDPATLEISGTPLRYTFDPATDRYPDVFRPGTELGRIEGEAPVRVSLEVPYALRGENWQWDMGDGATADGPEVTHSYTSPGEYRLVASAGERVLRGRVLVQPGQAPRPLRTQVREGGEEVTVLFDELIALQGASARFEHAGDAEGIEVGPDGTSVRIRPAQPVRRTDRLHLEGVVDLSAQANRMAAQVLIVEPADWPSRSQGLIFLWRTAAHENRVRDSQTDTDQSYLLERRYSARLTKDYAMHMMGGGFQRKDFGEFASRAQGTREFSIEMTLHFAEVPATRPGLIVAYGKRDDDRLFAVMQQQDELVVYVRTDESSPGGEAFPVAQLSGPGTHHVVVGLQRGHLEVFIDGKLVFDQSRIPTRLTDWAVADLSFGRERGGPNPWNGSIEGVAIYDRFLGLEEVADNARVYLEHVASRTPLNVIEVRARRTAVSAAPTLEEILPYKNGLVVHEYEVLEVLDGDLGEPRIRVVHWALLNGETRWRADGEVGEVLDMKLEAFSDHPEVQDLYLADDLPLDTDLPMFLEPGS